MTDPADVRVFRPVAAPQTLLIDGEGRAVCTLEPAEAIAFAAKILRAVLDSAIDRAERVKLAGEVTATLGAIIDDALAERTLQ
jgi:hypothetical protein